MGGTTVVHCSTGQSQMVTVTKLNVSNPDPNSGGGNVIDHRKTMHEILFYLMNRFSLPPLKEFRKPGILLDVWVCKEMSQCVLICATSLATVPVIWRPSAPVITLRSIESELMIEMHQKNLLQSLNGFASASHLLA